jgi:hypothetical protein
MEKSLSEKQVLSQAKGLIRQHERRLERLTKRAAEAIANPRPVASGASWNPAKGRMEIEYEDTKA